MKKTAINFQKRKARVRASIALNARGKLRLSVFRSNKNIYAQIIDDSKGVTLVAASTKDKEFTGVRNIANISAASEVGKSIALKAVAKDLCEVVFDRGGYLYHGKIKALADAARENGLRF